MKTAILAIIITLSGCSAIPSFWDDNQSKVAIDIVADARQINCDIDYKPQVKQLHSNLEWFISYSKAKGTDDVLEIAEVINSTVKPFAEKEELSPAFCNIKKKIIIKQTEAMGRAVLRRY
jgi:hypothetical protein